jgi:hypothetical protein
LALVALAAVVRRQERVVDRIRRVVEVHVDARALARLLVWCNVENRETEECVGLDTPVEALHSVVVLLAVVDFGGDEDTRKRGGVWREEKLA